MTKAVVNLTIPMVVEHIETALEDYPHYPYQKAFAIPDLRQKLIAYVLSRVANSYTVSGEGDNSITFRNCSSDQQLQIENLAKQGIQDILQQYWEWIVRHIPSESESGLVPSHWFG